MSKNPTSPGSFLSSLMMEYKLNPSSLSKAINLSQSAIRQIIIGKTRITPPTALRLSKFFDQPPSFWLDLQQKADLREAEIDKELSVIIKGIIKVKKPAAKPKTPSKKAVKS